MSAPPECSRCHDLLADDDSYNEVVCGPCSRAAANEKVQANMRIWRLEAALLKCASMAGTPDAADGCRLIIGYVKKTLEK